MENVSEEVVPIRKSLMKAYEEYWDTSEDGTSSPQLLFPDQSDSAILQFVNEEKWICALKYIRHNRLEKCDFYTPLVTLNRSNGWFFATQDYMVK